MEFFDANPEIKTQVEADVRRTIAERLAGTYGIKPNDPSDAKSEPVLGGVRGRVRRRALRGARGWRGYSRRDGGHLGL